MLPPTLRCRHHCSLRAAATVLPPPCCAPPPRFTLPLPPCRCHADTDVALALVDCFISVDSICFMEKLVSVGKISLALGVAFALSLFWHFPLGMVVLSDTLGEGSVIASALGVVLALFFGCSNNGSIVLSLEGGGAIL